MSEQESKSSDGIAKIWYSESRRFHLSKQIRPRVLESVKDKPDYKLNIENIGLENCNQFKGSSDKCNPAFNLSVIKDPSIGYESSRIYLLKLELNEDAVNILNQRFEKEQTEYIKNKGSDADLADEKYWSCVRVILTIEEKSPLGIFTSIFEVPEGTAPEHFEDYTQNVTDFLDCHWDLYEYILPELDKLTVNGYSTWNNAIYQYSLPESLLNANHPEFVLSEEYQLSSYIFISGDKVSIKKWKEQTGIKKFSDDGKFTLNPEDVVYVAWATTIFGSSEQYDSQRIFETVLKVRLASDYMKIVSFAERLCAGMLELSMEGKCSSDELRKVVNLYHLTRQNFWSKRLLLSENLEYYFSESLKRCNCDNSIESSRYMCDQLIKTAEGIEAYKVQRFERIIQVIGIIIAAFAVTTLVYDSFNFVNNNYTPHEVSRKVCLVIALSFSLVTSIVTGFYFVWKEIRKKK